MKKNASTRLIVWMIVTVALMAILIVGVGARDGSFFRADTTAPAHRESALAEVLEEITVQGIRNIHVEWISGAVEVSTHAGSAVMFHETSRRELQENETLRYRVDGDTLTISHSVGQLISFFGSRPSKTLHLQIPVAGLDSLHVEGVSNSANIAGGGMTVRSVHLETVSGSMRMEDVQGDSLRVEGVSGSVSVYGSFDKIKADTVSGSLAFRLPVTPRSFRADAVSGSVQVFLNDDMGFTARMDSISGGLRSDFGVTVEKNHIVYGDGAAALRVDSVSGSFSILQDASLRPVAAPEASASAPAPVPLPTATKPPIPSSQRSF